MKAEKKRDGRAPDGLVSYGDRLVRKGGLIKFAGADWQDDRLLPFVGQTLGVRAEGYWVTGITIYYPSYPNGELILGLGDRIYQTTTYDRVLSELTG